MNYQMHEKSYPLKAEVKRGVAFRAQVDGSAFYWTGKPCKRGHIAWRRTSSCVCIMCEKENANR